MSEVTQIVKKDRIPLFTAYRGQHLLNVLRCATTLNNEITLQFTPENLSVDLMDLSHVAMINLKLPMQYFYEWSAEFTGRICVNLLDFIKDIKTLKNTELKFTYLEATERLEVKVTTPPNQPITKTYVVLEDLGEEIPIPKIFFKSKTRILASPLKYAVDNITTSEHVKLSTDEENLTISASGDLGESKTVFRKGDDNTLDHRVEEPSESTYTLSYLKELLKPTVKISELIALELSTDMPLKLEIELPIGSMTYHLAPCIGV